ncbi:hypothetical protein LTR36_004512 [Oleoguttula mirabilis]|uniref:HAUS augmin-like complex subunit 6 N-terminal domain-containing protein n=1 Tax=Oleoguttula mirabilis TaxID=1507867 RepID=A0AAV9JGP8_9PEZI|nr:hypothetical protein LTR36_004512 [Oleoguttula mirabilis]
MERPMSGTQHKRTPSLKTGTRPITSTVVSLFATNLRLLNLDLLPDWPAITTASFGNHDARTRIRCTEFALYQLFRLYDPATTADKLQPFYPPLEPLQSINLRAGLYRCLNELKKNGVLGKETVLRKTMLDECSGDKFWEFCLTFSAIVLRKVTLEKRYRYGRPVAESLGTSQNMSKGQRDILLPLSVAHRVSLAQMLETKQRKKQTFARLYDVLVEKEAELLQRKAQAQERARSQPSTHQAERLEAVEHSLKKSWVGRKELQSVLVNGDTSAGGDGVLTKALDQVADFSTFVPAEYGLLEGLSQSANKQNERVRRWQRMHERLHASKQGPASTSDDASKASSLRFDKHRSLSVRDAPQMMAELPRQRSESQASASRYDEILTAMRDELRHNRRAAAPLSPPKPAASAKRRPLRKPSVHLDTAAGAVDPHRRSPSQTAVPMRPAMSRRTSSRSKSYQQPKVESQRQHIPLKSELFSPLKTQRRSSTSPLSSSSVLASPIEDGASPGIGLHNLVARGKRPVSQSSEANGTVDSGVGLGIVTMFPMEQRLSSSSATRAESSSESDDVITLPDRIFKVPAIPEPKSTPSNGNAARPSLAERTRMSMAFRSSEDITGLPPGPSASAVGTQQADHDAEASSSSTTPPEEADARDRPTTLLDRTRQSISQAPPPPQKKGPGHSRTRSSIYPINQFDTPQKVRRASLAVQGPASAAKKRDITPREQLFSPDAQYDSVFKPRPKVALSPVANPYGGDGDGDGDDDDYGRSPGTMDGSMGHHDLGRSSPLVGVGGRR